MVVKISKIVSKYGSLKIEFKHLSNANLVGKPAKMIHIQCDQLCDSACGRSAIVFPTCLVQRNGETFHVLEKEYQIVVSENGFVFREKTSPSSENSKCNGKISIQAEHPLLEGNFQEKQFRHNPMLFTIEYRDWSTILISDEPNKKLMQFRLMRNDCEDEYYGFHVNRLSIKTAESIIQLINGQIRKICRFCDEFEFLLLADSLANIFEKAESAYIQSANPVEASQFTSNDRFSITKGLCQDRSKIIKRSNFSRYRNIYNLYEGGKFIGSKDDIVEFIKCSYGGIEYNFGFLDQKVCIEAHLNSQFLAKLECVFGDDVLYLHGSYDNENSPISEIMLGDKFTATIFSLQSDKGLSDSDLQANLESVLSGLHPIFLPLMDFVEWANMPCDC